MRDRISFNEHNVPDELKEIKHTAQSLLHSRKYQFALNALRLMDMFKHSQDLFESFPDYSLPKNVIYELTLASERKTGFGLADDQQLEMWESIMNAPGVLVGWLFTAGLDRRNGSGFLFRAGHHIAEAASAEDTFRGLFARIINNDTDMYILQLDPGKSRETYDALITQNRIKTFDMILHGIRAKDTWLEPRSARKKYLVVINHEYWVEEVVPFFLQRNNPNIYNGLRREVMSA